MSPLILIAHSVQEGYFDITFDALREALTRSSSCQGLSLDIERLTGDVADLRSEIYGAFSEIDESAFAFFVDDYVRELSERGVEFPAHLWDSRIAQDELAPIIEMLGAEIPTKCESQDPELTDDDVAFLASSALGGPAAERYFLVPFLYLALLPFVRSERMADPAAAVRKVVIEEGAVGVEEIVRHLEADGGRVCASFVQAIAACDCELLNVYADDAQVSALQVTLPGIDLFAQGIPRRKYVRRELMYLRGDFLRNNLVVSGPPVLDSPQIDQFIGVICNGKVRPNVSTAEVAIKLIQLSARGERTVQEMGEALHKGIVRSLMAAQRAMTRDELQSTLGVPIRISPDILPPGRIMAYAPHPRFLREENAYYVLKDWVETDTQKRGRILRARVVTPFDNKEWMFRKELLFEYIASNRLFQFCGMFSSDGIARRIGRSLPGTPIEPYFIFKIRSRICEYVGAQFLPAGRGYFVDEGVAAKRLKDESNDHWRIRIVTACIGSAIDIQARIGLIDDAELRDEIRDSVRHSNQPAI